MYKVFANRLPIILTSKAKYLSNENTFLLSSLEIDEILKKLRKHKKIYLFFPKKKDLIKEFKSKIKTVYASGGIVKNKKSEILFIFRRGKWDLPKGKVEKYENISQAAIREVIEETGIEKISLIRPIEKTFHIFKRGKNHYLKCTYWFEMKSNFDGKFIPQKKEGITRVEWINEENLLNVLPKSYANIRLLFNYNKTDLGTNFS